jgi:Flp pilus assembly protein TadG
VARRRRDRGAAAVEMAIVLPLLLMVIAGIADLGRAFYYQLVISNAAREGARMLALNYTVPQMQSRVSQAAMDVGTVTTPTYVVCPSSIPSPPSTPPASSVTVQASGFQWMFLGDVATLFGTSIATPDIRSTGSMRCTG